MCWVGFLALGVLDVLGILRFCFSWHWQSLRRGDATVASSSSTGSRSRGRFVVDARRVASRLATCHLPPPLRVELGRTLPQPQSSSKLTRLLLYSPVKMPRKQPSSSSSASKPSSARSKKRDASESEETLDREEGNRKKKVRWDQAEDAVEDDEQTETRETEMEESSEEDSRLEKVRIYALSSGRSRC